VDVCGGISLHLMKCFFVLFERKTRELANLLRMPAVIFFVVLPAMLLAQKADIKFTTLTTENGLSQNYTTAILKDQYGFLWIGTHQDLNRYDGRCFKIYRLNNPESKSHSSEISAIYKDDAGILWVGTIGDGLFYYDRENDIFKRLTINDPSKKLDFVDILALSGDRNGQLWVGTITGLAIVDIAKRSAVNFQWRGSREKIPESIITCIYRDGHDRMWVGTNVGLATFDRRNRSLKYYKSNAGDKGSLASDSISSISEDGCKQIWVGTTNGLSRLERGEQKFTTYRYDYRNEHSLCGNLIYSIAAAEKNTIWVGSEGGLNVIDVISGRVTRYQHDPRDPFSIRDKSVRTIYVDSEGIYWVGTYMAGVNKYDKNLTLFNGVSFNELDPNGLSAPSVSSFAEGSNGEIYVGTDGGGLNLFSINSNRFRHINIKSKEKINSSGLPILTMIMDKKRQLWIGTYQHGLFKLNTLNNSYKQYTQGDGSFNINQNNIFCLKEDHTGKIWIGTNGAGVNVYDPTTERFQKIPPFYAASSGLKLPSNGYIRGIEEDNDGNIWIGSWGMGINVYHPATKNFETFDVTNTGLPMKNISTLFKDSKGRVWIGTGDAGLFYYDKDRSKIFPFKQNEKLLSHSISRILEDNTGNIWLSTDKGVYSFNQISHELAFYSPLNGLQSGSFLFGSGMRASNGTIYFGGVSGFNYFTPADIKHNERAPSVVLTTLSVDNRRVAPDQKESPSQNISQTAKVTIKYKQDFSISFVALNYTLPQQNKYAYILDGFSQTWSYPGKGNTASYTNLDPGEYTFRVKASNNDGIWNNTGASIKIIVTPPFWMTWYAYLCYVVTAFTILWLIRRQGIRRIKNEMRLEQRRKEAEAIHELDNMKIKFLTNLSHEFRTPISLILAPVDKLITLHAGEPITDQLYAIKRNGRRLLNLVNQLLDFRKLEENELKLNLTEGEFISFARDVADSFCDLANAKNIELFVDHPLKKIFAKFDHEKIERILFNLLSNAFKFTPSGGSVRLSICEKSFDKAKQLFLADILITDTGIGLSNAEAASVFDRFYQAVAPPSIINQGSGIGLSITKELVALHGGEISVESVPGKGSTFKVTLPLRAIYTADDTPSSTESTTLAKINVQPAGNRGNDLPHVLIIEDNDELRFYLADNLKAFYRVSEAIHGQDGWHKALASNPDIIISDISMPYMDGIAFSRKLRADKRTSHIPVILLTAFIGREEERAGLESGATDYLTKPFSFDILNIKVKNLLALNRNFKETYQRQLKVVMPDEINIDSGIQIEAVNAKFLSNIVSYIEENMTKITFSVEDISHKFGMSRSTLYTRIMELTGQPPVNLIRDVKLNKGALLLQKSNLSISQIAYDCGFATAQYFAKSFKEKYGMLPSEHRNQKLKLDKGREVK
jgi:signal transduction histidine kinase/ligand-binding sensor domain-containing protein/DNA-binding response OmpR family regulator